MGAEHEHLQRVVDVGGPTGPPRGEAPAPAVAALGTGAALLSTHAGAVGTALIDQPARGDGDEPPARPIGDTLAGPLVECRRQGLLRGVLAVVERVTPSQQGGEDVRRLATPHVLHDLPGVGPAKRHGRTRSGLAAGAHRGAQLDRVAGAGERGRDLL